MSSLKNDPYIEILLNVLIKKNINDYIGTIIFSIHQPRYSIFKLFDTVTFMCKGRCIYHGDAQNVVPYFATLGYQCETYDNPTDFVLDILIDAFRTPDILMKLISAYMDSSMHTNAITLAKSERKGSSKEQSIRSQGPMEIEAAQSLGKEIYYVSQRTLRNSLRNPAMALAQAIVSILMGFLVGIVFYDLKNTIDPGIRNRQGTIFFIIVNQIFGTMSAVEPLLQERPLFLHVSGCCFFIHLCRKLIFFVSIIGICQRLLSHSKLFYR